MQIIHCDFCRQIPAKRLHLHNGDNESFVMDICFACMCDWFVELLIKKFPLPYNAYMNKLCDDTRRAIRNQCQNTDQNT